MKEISIEEKAKRYDEAIKYAYYLINERCKKGTDGSFHRADLQKMFPELAKLEDEKISKEIIDIINSYDVYHLKVAGLPSRIPEYIYWLEKQGEYANFRNKIQIGDKVTRNEDGVLVNLSQLKRVAKKDEKQGKQKPQGKSALEAVKEEKIDNANKAESKFKVGDWVVVDGVTQQVTQIRPEGFDTNRAWNGKLTFKDVHLWTIQDAKDGDVLFTSSTASHETFIFKSIDERGNAECYFAYDSEDGFREGKYHFIGSATNCKPATKEQRDTLMKAMADAGYTFNFEKKELKKIEQEQVVDYPDSLPKDNWELIHEFVNKFGRIPKDEDELNVLIEYVLKRQKPAWSEEDKKMLNDILMCGEHHCYLDAGNIAWLKSLKDRVHPQSKQEWSERDERKIGDIRDAITLDDELEESYKEKLYNFLKSLRPQNRWKPSDAQMEGIECTIKTLQHQLNVGDKRLNSLYTDLKKLREELL